LFAPPRYALTANNISHLIFAATAHGLAAEDLGMFTVVRQQQVIDRLRLSCWTNAIVT